MRISDWSSDVCSSDLADVDAAIAANVELITAVDADDAEVLDRRLGALAGAARHRDLALVRHPAAPAHPFELDAKPGRILRAKDRKSVVKGKSVSDRVDLGSHRIN